MEDAHTLSIDSHVNLASRATAAEAEAFMQAFGFHIKTTTESDALVHTRYFHRHTGRYYHVSATSLEIEEDLSRDFLQKLTDLFPWAIQKEEEGRKELSGRLLGVSGRVDGLQGCDVGKAAGMGSGRSVKVDDLALVLCHPNGPCGELGKLPRELRDEVYKHAFPRTFWQCYHTKLPGITLLDVTHSSSLPGILNVSKWKKLWYKGQAATGHRSSSSVQLERWPRWVLQINRAVCCRTDSMAPVISSVAREPELSRDWVTAQPVSC